MEKELKEKVDFFRSAKKGTIGEMAAPQFISCDEKEQTFISLYRTDERMENPNGVLHGGLIATIMDNAMGILANYYGEERLTQTVSFQVSYLRPGILGEEVYVKARLTKRGKTMQYVSSEAWLAGKEDKLIATATGVYFTQGEGGKLHKKNDNFCGN